MHRLSDDAAAQAAALVGGSSRRTRPASNCELYDDGSAGGHVRWIAGHVLAHQLKTISLRDLQRA